MSEQKYTDVNVLGEFGLIDHLTKDIKLRHNTSTQGIGDDAAVITYGNTAVLISTEIMVEDIHFDMIYSPLKHLGYKAVINGIADIYAMNATPSQLVVSLAFSSKYTVEALDEFYAGIKAACDMYNVDLVGGDTTSAPRGLIINVTAIGSAPLPSVVYRSGAKVGDIICVTGDLGAAYLGLQLLEREKQLFLDDPELKPEFKGHEYLIERQLKPEAPREAVAYFAKHNFQPTAMIDVSDGLASDLFHICKKSDVGAYIEESKIPMRDEVQLQALEFNIDPLNTALNGGEDYELLFTIDEKDLEKVRYMPNLHIIGEIVPKDDGIMLHTSGGSRLALKAPGWKEHQ